MNAQLTAGLAVLDEMYDALIELVRHTEDDALNWSPPVPEANSIAALTRHIAGSIDAWLTRALAEPLQRDREAEFRFRGTAQELTNLLGESRAKYRDQFERLDAIDPAAIRLYKRLGHEEESALTVAWCIEHALVHAAEHWGQIQLNRQLYAVR
ncbi:MAG: hypothetical protein QOF01_2477 [Thermomicrobiales bacterium]|jgi:uncharacterized damage-inducible protein DinB|nr:hypothetical protein [Thermomicrobiales bacterium]MEA2530095.1 hypothetical protein [Thermomicrobiales bacterium]MEA2596008.1 hypothetical protein [Thermomicrobiales bacterium]